MEPIERAARKKEKAEEKRKKDQEIKDTEALVMSIVPQHADKFFAKLQDGGFSFCVASVSLFGKKDDGEIFPSEFSVVRATVLEGPIPTRVVHRIFKCENRPMGYYREFAENVKKTHKIPLDFPGCTAYENLVAEIQSVVGDPSRFVNDTLVLCFLWTIVFPHLNYFNLFLHWHFSSVWTYQFSSTLTT